MNLREFAALSDAALFSDAIFGERHLINGREALVSLDRDLELGKRATSLQNESLVPSGADLILFIRKRDFEGTPEVKKRLMLDKKAMTIWHVEDEDTIWKLSLVQSRG